MSDKLGIGQERKIKNWSGCHRNVLEISGQSQTHFNITKQEPPDHEWHQ